MKETDLSPESVDSLPVRIWKPSIEILDYRVGHIFDPHGYLTSRGIMARDSRGIEWEIMESRMGIFKRKKCPDLPATSGGNDGNTQQNSTNAADQPSKMIDKTK